MVENINRFYKKGFPDPKNTKRSKPLIVSLSIIAANLTT